jgi:hypothetical protein
MIASDRRFLEIFTYYFSFTLPVTVIAFFAGNLTGLSRSPAIGSVLPAVLALLAGLMVYVFGSENRFKIVVGYSSFMFCFYALRRSSGRLVPARNRTGGISQVSFRTRISGSNVPKEFGAARGNTVLDFRGRFKVSGQVGVLTPAAQYLLLIASSIDCEHGGLIGWRPGSAGDPCVGADRLAMTAQTTPDPPAGFLESVGLSAGHIIVQGIRLAIGVQSLIP